MELSCYLLQQVCALCCDREAILELSRVQNTRNRTLGEGWSIFMHTESSIMDSFRELHVNVNTLCIQKALNLTQQIRNTICDQGSEAVGPHLINRNARNIHHLVNQQPNIWLNKQTCEICDTQT